MVKKGKTKQIRILKDGFMKGYYSVHLTERENGTLSYESVIGIRKTKADAIKLKNKYLIIRKKEKW